MRPVKNYYTLDSSVQTLDDETMRPLKIQRGRVAQIFAKTPRRSTILRFISFLLASKFVCKGPISNPSLPPSCLGLCMS